MKKGNAKKKKQKSKNPVSKAKYLSQSGFQLMPMYAVGIVFVLALIAFFPAIFNDFVDWDDPFYIKNNARIKEFDFGNIVAMFNLFPEKYLVSNYHPLTELSLAVNSWISGTENAQPYHLTNVLLHAFNTVFVFLFVQRLLKGHQLAAMITALLFAIHPMHVESVAWASERKDVLHVFFYLLALLQYLKYIETNQSTKHLIFTMLLFVCACLSKAQAVTLPLVLVLIDYYRGRKFNAKVITEKAPFFVVSLLFGILAIYAQSSGNAVSSANIPTWHRPFTGSMALLTYLFKLVIPTGLCAIHPYPYGKNIPAYFYPSLVGLLGYLYAIYYCFKNDKKIWCLGLTFFIATIFPVLQFITVGIALWAERYTYLPYVGLFLIIGYYFDDIYNNKTHKFRTPAMGLMGLALVGCLLLTWNRISYWKNSKTLWTQVIEKHPKVVSSYVNLSLYLSDNQEYQECIRIANDGIKLAPDKAKLYSNKGFCEHKLSKNKEAIQTLRKGISLDPEKQDLYFMTGLAYTDLKDNENALKMFDKSIQLEPEHANSYLKRGTVLSNYRKDYKAAIRDFKKLLEYEPNNIIGLNNMALTCFKDKNMDQCIEYASRAIKLEPNNHKGYLYRAMAYDSKQDYRKALTDGRKAKQLGSNSLNSYIPKWEAAIK